MKMNADQPTLLRPVSRLTDVASTSLRLDGRPARFDTAEFLDEFMSRPSAALIQDLQAVDGDIMVIGVAGKMGPTLARMAKRAVLDRRVIGVARFSDAHVKSYLEDHGVETISADLLKRSDIAALPKVKNIVFMAGLKFGSTGSEDLTWAMNAYIPGLVADHFSTSRFVVFSTICVYPFVPVLHGGSRETDELGPPGEYAMSCVGRERMFRHFSLQHQTRGSIIRLSYAIDMRYGVLHDIGSKVLRGEPIDLAMGHVNVIWQGDACSQALRTLRHGQSPCMPFNITGPETLSIRALALAFGRRFGKTPILQGVEAPTAWVANTSLAEGLFGYPDIPVDVMVDWTADWLARDMGSLGKATHFELRSGTY
jgi:nucleoside-diphosphate-sugar epimerase